jgi:hypothetical protein
VCNRHLQLASGNLHEHQLAGRAPVGALVIANVVNPINESKRVPLGVK